eukprot:CAMPEP_0179998460 /NCGR_PEP_ID=MMETSP0984-20121128/8703_1 /TAXON_ID=483367 /ORGANISM="non described non described, Strain CCMP 2436" /LENGTH=171 /DNA_ID=CAMNT_0021918165 /DNA_START=789 /DNA_END=1301 /DNA_ORIENTATION=-
MGHRRLCPPVLRAPKCRAPHNAHRVRRRLWLADRRPAARTADLAHVQLLLLLLCARSVARNTQPTSSALGLRRRPFEFDSALILIDCPRCVTRTQITSKVRAGCAPAAALNGTPPIVPSSLSEPPSVALPTTRIESGAVCGLLIAAPPPVRLIWLMSSSFSSSYAHAASHA